MFRVAGLLILLLTSEFCDAGELKHPLTFRVKGDVTKLLAKLDKVKEKHRIPAYALVITTPTKIVVQQIRGSAAANTTQAVSQDAYFRIGSITKTFIGLAALIAESQDKLNLNDSVYQYLSPQIIENTFSENHDIKVAHLLEHTSGLPDMSKPEFDSNDVVTIEQGLNRFSQHRKNIWPAGHFYSYSNTNYGLAGRVIEIATQQNLEQWLTESLFKPLGMQSATLDHNDKVKQYLVPGYQRNGIETIPYWNMIYPSLGAMNIRPGDMAKLIQLYLQNGNRYISAAMITRQETPKTSLAARAGLSYGYALGLYQWFRDGYRFYGHGGDADGYLSHFGYQKDIQLGYFVVINTFNGRAKREMKSIIEHFIVENSRGKDLNTKETGSKTRLKMPSNERLDDYAGEYLQATKRFARENAALLHVKVEDSQLQIKDDEASQWRPLISLGNGIFRHRFEPAASIVFFTYENRIYMVGDEGNFVKR